MAETSARDDENNGLNSDDNRNLAPAVGVLANELTDDRRAAYVEPFIPEEEQDVYSSWIGDCHIKFVEMGGSQVVPIPLYQSEEFYRHVFDQTNGLYIPGDVSSDETNRITMMFMRWSKEAGDAGDTFPIWGPYWTIKGSTDILDSQQITCGAISFIEGPGWNESKFIQSLPQEMREKIKTECCVHEDDRIYLTEEDFQNSTDIKAMFKYVAGRTGKDNKTYINLIENEKYDWYQFQFHPEKTSYLQDPAANIIFTDLAVRFSFECAMFFIDQARKNTHRLDDLSLLIYKEKRIHPSKVQENSSIPLDQSYSSVYLLRTQLLYNKDNFIFP